MYTNLYSNIDTHNSTEECWDWLGGFYGGNGRPGCTEGLAYRVIYEDVFDEKIPKGKVASHICHNKKCVNPYHIVIESQGDNVRRSSQIGRYGNSRPWKGVYRGANKSAKPVSVQGVVYSSLLDAADAHGVHEQTIRQWHKTGRNNTFLIPKV